jgi:hypothetical protein
MLSDKEKVSLKEILILMSEEDFKMLAQSITENMIVPLNTQQAIDAIFLHSATELSLLLQEGIPREILFRYLHSKKPPQSKQIKLLRSVRFSRCGTVLLMIMGGHQCLCLSRSLLWTAIQHNQNLI